MADTATWPGDHGPKRSLGTIDRLSRYAYPSPTLSGIEESGDFHDPYSDLNLFLAQQVKKEIQKKDYAKEWSRAVERELVAKIQPEFQKKFSNYRLSSYSLRRTFEKARYYHEKLRVNPRALTSEGTIDVSFMIKENLKSFFLSKRAPETYPYNIAHRMATQICECVAAYDGLRLSLQQITQEIWSMLKYLLPHLKPGQYKSPFDDFDVADKLIIKTLLESGDDLTFDELKRRIRETIEHYRSLPAINKSPKVYTQLACIYGNICSESLDLAHSYDSQELFALREWILKEKASGRKSHEIARSRLDENEALIWALLYEFEREKGEMTSLMRREILKTCLDYPDFTFQEVVQTTMQFFRKAKEIATETNWEERVDFWAAQGDLIYSFVELGTEVVALSQLKSLKDELAERKKMVEKRVWYQSSEPAYTRYVKWIAKKKPQSQLAHHITKRLPLAPLSDAVLDSILNKDPAPQAVD